MIALALALLAGCAIFPKTKPAGGTAASAPVDDETSPLAEQARRDVEQIQRLSASGGPPADASADSSPKGPPKIDWILPKEPSATPSTASTQEPLARDTHRPGGTAAQLPLPMPTELPGGSIAPEPPDVPDAVATADGDALRRLVVELSAELYRRGAYSDMPLRELLLIAATTMVTPDRALVPEALPGLTPREREIVGLVQDFFRQLGRELTDKGDPEVLVAALDELASSLHTQPRLVLPTAVLCTRVGGFGDYNEFQRNEDGRYRFLAHSGQQAVVYVEVENFTSERNKQGQWVTELSQELVVFSDRDGIPVWREDWQLGTDSSKNRREDFFIVQIITLPEQLSVGLYQLKIHVRDKRSGAESEATVEFEMVADSRMMGQK